MGAMRAIAPTAKKSASVDWAPSCMLTPLAVSEATTMSTAKRRKTSSVCENACVSVQDVATQCDIITTSSVGTQCLIQPRTANKSKFIFLDTIL